MSSTSKARLQGVKDQIDQLFATAHPSDVPELVKELRDDLSLKASASRRPGYDKKPTVG